MASIIGTDNGGFVADGTTITRSYTTTTGNNKTLFFTIEWAGTGPISGITFDGNAATAISGASGTNPSGPGTAECWQINLGNHTGKTANVVVSATAGIYGRLQIYEIDDVNQTTPAHDGTGTFEETDPSSITVSNVASTDIIIDCLIALSTASPATAGANQTQIANEQGTNGVDELACSSHQSGADGGVMTWDLAGGFRWAAAAFAVTAATEEPPVSPPAAEGQPFHRRFWGIPGHAGYSIGGHVN